MIYNNFFSWKKQELSLNLESQEDVCREAGRSDPPRQTRLLQWEQYRYWGRAMFYSQQVGKNSQLNPKDWICNWQWPSEVKKLQQCIGTVGGLQFPPGNALQPFLPQTLQPRVPTCTYHTERSHWEAHLSTQGGCARMSLQRVTSNLHQGRIYPELGSLGLNLDCKMYSHIRAACYTHHHRDERVEAHPIKEEMLMDVISFHIFYFYYVLPFSW